MPIVHHELTTPYTASEMFAVVIDVNNYLHFLPYCKNSHLLSQDNENLRVRLMLAKGAFQKTLALHYRLQKDKLIEMGLIEGPFKRLHGYWRFEPLEQGHKFIFHLEYEFMNKLTSLPYSHLFSQIANTLAQTFCQRAAMVYGKLGQSAEKQGSIIANEK